MYGYAKFICRVEGKEPSSSVRRIDPPVSTLSGFGRYISLVDTPSWCDSHVLSMLVWAYEREKTGLSWEGFHDGVVADPRPYYETLIAWKEMWKRGEIT